MSAGLLRLSFALARSPLAFRVLKTALTGRHAPYARKIRPLLAPGPVLDVGCGTGELSRFLDRPYVGVDVDAGFLREARRQTPKGRLLAASGTRLPFRDAAFGTALLVDALHHLSDAEAQDTLAEAARVSRGGVVVLDPIPPKGTGLRAWLHDLDRGRHMRPMGAQRALISRRLRIDHEDAFWCDTGVYRFSVFRAGAA